MGWSRTETNAALSLRPLVSGLAAYPIGIWVVDHGHGRKIIMVGACSILSARLKANRRHVLIAIGGTQSSGSRDLPGGLRDGDDAVDRDGIQALDYPRHVKTRSHRASQDSDPRGDTRDSAQVHHPRSSYGPEVHRRARGRAGCTWQRLLADAAA